MSMHLDHRRWLLRLSAVLACGIIAFLPACRNMSPEPLIAVFHDSYWSDTVADILQDARGNYVLIGGKSAAAYFDEGPDLWVAMLSRKGRVNWSACLEEDLGPAESASVCESVNGSYVIVSRISKKDAVGTDIWCALFSRTGRIDWQRRYIGEQSFYPACVQQSGDGGFLIVGSYGKPFEDADAFAMKIKESGTPDWVRCYGGELADEANSVAIDNSGSVVVVGETRSYGAGEHDCWVLTLDSEGHLERQMAYGGPGIEWANAVEVESDGTVVIGGMSSSVDPYGDAWILALQADGAVLMSKTFGEPSSTDIAHDVCLGMESNRLAVVGSTSYPAEPWILLLDDELAILWEKVIEREGWASAVTLTAGGHYAVAGVERYPLTGNEMGQGIDHDVIALTIDESGSSATDCFVDADRHVQDLKLSTSSVHTTAIETDIAVQDVATAFRARDPGFVSRTFWCRSMK